MIGISNTVQVSLMNKDADFIMAIANSILSLIQTSIKSTNPPKTHIAIAQEMKVILLLLNSSSAYFVVAVQYKNSPNATINARIITIEVHTAHPEKYLKKIR